MKITNIMFYLGVLLLAYTSIIIMSQTGFLIEKYQIFKIIEVNKVIIGSIFIGGIGGIVYCSRSIYINYAVKNEWNEKFWVWYAIRPIVSLIIGAISYLFIKAGLMIFSSSEEYQLNEYSIWSLAFISGLNVDKFLKKLESVGETVWGITPSNMAKEQNNNTSENTENNRG